MPTATMENIIESIRLKKEVCDNCKAALKGVLTPEQLEIFEGVFQEVSSKYLFSKKQ